MTTHRLFVPLLAAAGFAAALGMIVLDDRDQASPASAALASRERIGPHVAGTGLVEAKSGNIAVGTPVSGVVVAIYVKWGDWVNKGDPLFKVDDRDLQAQIPPARARIVQMDATSAKLRNLLKLGEELQVGRSISALDLSNRRYDVGVAEAGRGLAEAQVEQLKLQIETHTVRALVAGRILQINTHLGEYATSGVLAQPLMMLGDDSRLQIRVDIDESDAWRVKSGAPATAFVRSNPAIRTPLTFERIELYVVPKLSLTGGSTERTDMRVLQVIYSFDPANLSIFIGQQMDVDIDASSTNASLSDAFDGRKP